MMNLTFNLIYYIIKYGVIAILIAALLYAGSMIMFTILIEMISLAAWITE